jgi:hypothetical protein
MNIPKRAGDSLKVVDLIEEKNMHGVHMDYQANNHTAMERTRVLILLRSFLQLKKAGSIICICAKEPETSPIAMVHKKVNSFQVPICR